MVSSGFSTQIQQLDANELESSHNAKDIRQSHNHGLPITHSSTRGWLWDVRPQPTATIAKSSLNSTPSSFPPDPPPARSETSESFPWHTDCSYEECPPNFFALQVLHADTCGGGTLSVMQLSRLLPLLSPTARKYLSRAEYRITVPPEFVKRHGQRYIVGSILNNGGDELRFREDIITPLTTSGGEALEELKDVLRSSEARSQTISLSLQVLPSGSIVLVGNRQWLHARNEVRDPKRHLRRVRWDARPFVEYSQ
ncbi:hypothetical protein PENVUL_c001G08664 [Penicillium vulpinum]|uniref:TauD/TfdA-like domain-containing protein n=1 Tax=Penicillium vulpinum TaxID=29845 RepID=A0A1V6SFL6_9EURO|nr:hypothetical protein PENVUL_c001G08664 [Penicillium vulpinum]